RLRPDALPGLKICGNEDRKYSCVGSEEMTGFRGLFGDMREQGKMFNYCSHPAIFRQRPALEGVRRQQEHKGRKSHA
ncbi:MAG: hypothetical protein K1W40_16440, partial [Schaedlerella sp.]|uniref:hypothetical protein n=1 Tax=Schaedlerella sp. TaxID=2676057 RepID=UPI0035282E8B